MGTHDITDEKAEKNFTKEISGFQTEWSLRTLRTNFACSLRRNSCFLLGCAMILLHSFEISKYLRLGIESEPNWWVNKTLQQKNAVTYNLKGMMSKLYYGVILRMMISLKSLKQNLQSWHGSQMKQKHKNSIMNLLK